MRILLYHLPEVQINRVMERVLQILKPNGWLIIEDLGRHTGHSTSRGPAQSVVDSIYLTMLREKGLNPIIGEHLGQILQSTNAFSEINAKKIELVLSTNPTLSMSSRERGLSNALRSTIDKVLMKTDISEDLRSAGITPDLQFSWLEERMDPSFKTFHDVWFTWSRKRKI